MAPISTTKIVLAFIAAAAGIDVAAPSHSWAEPAGSQPTCPRVRGDGRARAELTRTKNGVGHFARLRIVALGSSSTYGVGASDPSRSYPAQLERLLSERLPGVDTRVANLGVSGELAKSAAERIAHDVLPRHPDLLIWQVGTSDGVQTTSKEAYAKVLRETLKKLRAADIDVMLVGMQWNANLEKSAHYVEINDATERVAEEENLLFVRRYEMMRASALAAGHDTMLSADGFHLNDLGYRCLAEAVADLITSSVVVDTRTR